MGGARAPIRIHRALLGGSCPASAIVWWLVFLLVTQKTRVQFPEVAAKQKGSESSKQGKMVPSHTHSPSFLWDFLSHAV